MQIFWNDTGSRSASFKGSTAWNNFKFYDGCDNVKSAVYDHAEKSSQTKITGSICNNLYDWNRDGGILV